MANDEQFEKPSIETSSVPAVARARGMELSHCGIGLSISIRSAASGIAAQRHSSLTQA